MNFIILWGSRKNPLQQSATETRWLYKSICLYEQHVLQKLQMSLKSKLDHSPSRMRRLLWIHHWSCWHSRFIYREDMIPWAYVQINFFWWTLWSPTRPFSVRLSWVSSSRKPWFTTLKLDSNYSWVKLKKCFMDKFSMIEDLPKIKGELTNIKQWDEESLLSFLEKFKKASVDVEDLSINIIHTYFEGELKDPHLMSELQLLLPHPLAKYFATPTK